MDRLPSAILFDLDDTIVSFSAGKPNFWREGFLRHGSALACGVEAFEAAVEAVSTDYWSDPARAHRGRLDLWRARRDIAALSCARLGLSAASVAHAIADHYTAEKERLVAPFPGAVETLVELRARGVRLGLVTNGSSEFQRKKLARFDLESLFEAIAIEGELGVGKPDPRPFLFVLERMRLQPGDACMVGDNLSADIAGAQALGMATVWNDHAGAGLPHQSAARPDRIIRHVADLLAPAG